MFRCDDSTGKEFLAHVLPDAAAQDRVLGNLEIEFQHLRNLPKMKIHHPCLPTTLCFWFKYTLHRYFVNLAKADGYPRQRERVSSKRYLCAIHLLTICI